MTLLGAFLRALNKYNNLAQANTEEYDAVTDNAYAEYEMLEIRAKTKWRNNQKKAQDALHDELAWLESNLEGLDRAKARKGRKK